MICITETVERTHTRGQVRGFMLAAEKAAHYRRLQDDVRERFNLGMLNRMFPRICARLGVRDEAQQMTMLAKLVVSASPAVLPEWMCVHSQRTAWLTAQEEAAWLPTVNV